MKIKQSIRRGKYLFYLIFVTLLFTSCDYGLVKNEDMIKALEQAYFEGQKDALNNDIRIKRNQDSCWIWTKSPWDNGEPPIYNPSYECQ